MRTVQEDWWASDFGDSYVDRNRLDYRVRVPFWRDILDLTNAKWVCEVGCNLGSNLKAIRDCDPHSVLLGVDVNEKALTEARDTGLMAVNMPASNVGRAYHGTFDLVFTAGVLIHISPDHISEVMDSIVAASRKYVLAVEYAAETEEEIDYRGHSERLWRRPFGTLYQDKGLRLVKEWDAGEGFDRCTAWLLSRNAA